LRLRRTIGGWKLQDAHLLLIDDVRTTGATLKSAVRLLRTLKPDRVVCGVLAVSDAKSRAVRSKPPRAIELVQSL
jgi:predicted amidophosphoribosyltransferase